AFGQRRDRHPAGVGDPRRRGRGAARRDRRPARRRRAVLPTLARPVRARGADPADRSVHLRSAGGAGRPGSARGARSARGGGAAGRGGMNPPPSAAVQTGVDWEAVRADFPLLRRQVHGKPLVYLDSANTGQKPAVVIEAVDRFYRQHNANVSRAVHQLGSEATEAYEGARRRLATFINARPSDLVLCSGTTFAINLVAYSWALPRLKAGDTILVSRMEHHANIVPWQLVAERTGATVRVAEINQDGSLDLEALHKAMTPDVKLLAIAHVSNLL